MSEPLKLSEPTEFEYLAYISYGATHRVPIDLFVGPVRRKLELWDEMLAFLREESKSYGDDGDGPECDCDWCVKSRSVFSLLARCEEASK